MLSKTVPKERLRELMSRHELTGFQVARILKLKPQTVYSYMCGVRRFRQKQLETIQKAVGHGQN